MHRYDFLSEIMKCASACVKFTRVVLSGIPRPLHQPFVIPFIDDGIQSLSKGNPATRFSVHNFNPVYDGRSTLSITASTASKGYDLLMAAAGRALVIGVGFLARFLSATLTKRLCTLFMQVRHSIPRYCVRRGAALRFPLIIQVSHG